MFYQNQTFRFPVKFRGAIGQMSGWIDQVWSRSQHPIHFWQMKVT